MLFVRLRALVHSPTYIVPAWVYSFEDCAGKRGSEYMAWLYPAVCFDSLIALAGTLAVSRPAGGARFALNTKWCTLITEIFWFPPSLSTPPHPPHPFSNGEIICFNRHSSLIVAPEIACLGLFTDFIIFSRLDGPLLVVTPGSALAFSW